MAVLILVAALTGAAPASAQDPLDAFAEFEALCLDWDGDLVAAEEMARARGYQPAQDRVEALDRSSVARFAWVKSQGGVEAQLVLRVQGFIGNGNASMRAYHDSCSVSVRPGQRGRLRDRLARRLEQDSFRQKDTSVFAWTVGPEGREPVRRNVFETRLLSLFNDRGMRMATVAEHQDQVILSLFVPARMDCRLRADYSPTEPNIICGAAG